MRLLITTAIALTAAFVAGGPTIDLAAAPVKGATNVKVIVSFEDGVNDKIQSDGFGQYQDGVGSVVAYIAASDKGQLIFSTVPNSGNRTLRFFFDNCLSAPVDCNAPWAYLNERSGILANVLRNGSVPSGGLMAMTTTEGELQAWIKMDIPLDSDPAFWNLCFDAAKAHGTCGLAPGANSTNARIRRDTATQWTISANGTSDRADLIRDSSTNRNRTFSFKGMYSMPFSFTVQCVNANCS